MSTDNADPATINRESTVDIMAAVIAASMIAPSVAGRTAVAIIGMARSPVASDGKSTIDDSASTKTRRLMPRIITMAKSTPRRIVRMSFIAYSLMSFSGVATPPRKKDRPIVSRRVAGMASQLNTRG